MASTRTGAAPRALISGASFAGLTAAFWMRELGFEVTVVETGAGLRRGGTPVNIREGTVEIAERMGILGAIRARSLPPRTTEFMALDGSVVARVEPEPVRPDGTVDGYEIHRDDLLAILFAELEGDTEVLFDNAIASLTDLPHGVRASFRDGTERDFAVVLGCDGNHSAVRRMRFGPEKDYSRFLHHYFSVAIVDEVLIAPGTTRITNTPGRTLMLNAYEKSTDIVVVFHADEEIPYDHRDVDGQKRILRERAADAGPQFAELVDKAVGADTFYFDALSRTEMPSWTTGRVALVGDSGYCASPAAGMGGSLAIMGATALYDAFRTTDGDIEAAFAEYERTFRPIVEAIQAEAVDVGLATFFPETEEAIQARNAFLTGN